MNKIKIVMIAIFLILLSLFIYYEFRIDHIKSDYRKDLAISSEANLNIFQKKIAESNPSVAKLNQFIRDTYKNNSLIAGMLIANNKRIILAKAKNNTYIKTSDIFTAIINNFKKNNYALESDGLAAMNFSDKKLTFTKTFFMYPKSYNKFTIAFIYPLTITKKYATKVSLEILLIIILIIILCTIVYITSKKKSGSEEVATAINVNSKTKKLQRNDATNYKKNTTNIVAVKALNNYVFELFKKIYAEFATETISLYIFNPPDLLTKTYELKGKSFIKIDSSSFDTISLEDDIGKELQSSSILIMDEGKKIILPLTHHNSFLGTLIINRNSSLDANEIDIIKNHTSEILKHLSEYIVINNVMIDETTGLYSQTYFNIKYNELLRRFHNHSHDFSLCFIALGDNYKNLPSEEKATVTKIIASSLQENTTDEKIICKLNNILAIILPETDAANVKKTAFSFIDLIAKFKIKINANTTIMLRPAIGISSSSQHANQDMPQIAKQDMLNAIKKMQMQ